MTKQQQIDALQFKLDCIATEAKAFTSYLQGSKFQGELDDYVATHEAINHCARTLEAVYCDNQSGTTEY
jgi:hypothetical protein